ncbi:MAG: SGNH/GDSL hydrolase family protein [Proteobacteria bacterium]|nr:SGNH/GDSL hydrolase family protein [Pseudomonadota bacterium]MBS0573068.1 SGNH/GDSL hydrolase family protein [Pseudomonadota bacterium]
MAGLRALAIAAFLSAACGAALVVVASLDGPGDRPLPARTAAPHPLRIVALGTSLTRRALWPDRLAEGLGRCQPPGSVVTRVARAGAGSDWALGEIDAIAAQRPDLVIIELAMNDGDLTDGLWPARSRQNHRALISRLRAASPGTAILLLTTNPAVGWARATRPFLALYQRLYGRIADGEGTGLFDGYGRWRRLPGAARHIPDGVHPDPATEADLFAGPMQEAIAHAFGLTCP